MISGFHHVTLNVSDLPRARAFYEGVLGFEVDQDFPGYKLRVRVGESRAFYQTLTEPPSGQQLDTAGLRQARRARQPNREATRRPPPGAGDAYH